jgi:putative flippase GtrA
MIILGVQVMANFEKKTELLRSLKFLFFSVSAGIIEIVSFAILNELLGWPYWPCYLIALILSVIWNFTLNRRYTFRSASNVPVAMAKVFLFYLVFTPASTVLGNWLAEDLGWNEYLVTALNMIMNFVLEFLYDRFVVFRDSIDTNALAKKDRTSKG